jgi:hypothetical protein
MIVDDQKMMSDVLKEIVLAGNHNERFLNVVHYVQKEYTYFELYN